MLFLLKNQNIFKFYLLYINWCYYMTNKIESKSPKKLKNYFEGKVGLDDIRWLINHDLDFFEVRFMIDSMREKKDIRKILSRIPVVEVGK